MSINHRLRSPCPIGISSAFRITQTYFGHVNKPSTGESASHRYYFGFLNYVLTHLLTTRWQYGFASMKLKPQKREYLQNKQTYSKRKTPFFVALKSLSNRQQLFFTSWALYGKLLFHYFFCNIILTILGCSVVDLS